MTTATRGSHWLLVVLLNPTGQGLPQCLLRPQGKLAGGLSGTSCAILGEHVGFGEGAPLEANSLLPAGAGLGSAALFQGWNNSRRLQMKTIVTAIKFLQTSAKLLVYLFSRSQSLCVQDLILT